jgi:hypothetical protein
MATKRFTDPYELLNWMLNTHEAQPNRVASILATPDYEKLGYEEIARFDGILQAAERVGAVRREYVRQGRPEQGIKNVRLLRADTLYTHLRREPSSSEADRAAATLFGLVSDRPGYIRRIPEELQKAWRHRAGAHQISYCDTATAKTFLKLLCGFDDNLHDGVDQKTFCSRATGDSKAIERGGHASRLARVLGPAHGLSGPPDEILSALGILKFPTPICFTGPVAVGDIDFGCVTPYAAIAPDNTCDAVVTGQPCYVLSIENFASFNRYVREIDDGGLVVFTAGYPSKAMARFLARLDATAPSKIPFYHWGDVEEGGLQAFRIIEKSITRPLRPHGMDIETARRLGSAVEHKPRLKELAQSDSAISHLARWLCEGPEPHFLEQETLDPTSPILSE